MALESRIKPIDQTNFDLSITLCVYMIPKIVWFKSAAQTITTMK